MKCIYDQQTNKKCVRKWSPEEDALMITLIEEYGTRQWGKIGSELNGRTGKQCRERWHNHLGKLADVLYAALT